MAEDGTWPSIRDRGLLSTQAIVDMYEPDDTVRAEILTAVRRRTITLESDSLGPVTIRDQIPAKFLDRCMTEGTRPQDFLDALNSRVFFWLTRGRLEKLLKARLYRNLSHTVLHVDTAALLSEYGARVQLAPYNTGSMHVPNAPKRGPETFVNLADYPYETWVSRRGRAGDPVVELTLDYAVPDISALVVRAETWAGGQPTETLYRSAGRTA
jgi:hypothetical protein